MEVWGSLDFLKYDLGTNYTLYVRIPNSEIQNTSKNKGRTTTLHTSRDTIATSWQNDSELVQCTVCAAVLGGCAQVLGRQHKESYR